MEIGLGEYVRADGKCPFQRLAQSFEDSAVISSLWAVSDISTSFLMRRSSAKNAALREAQQWVRDVTMRDIRPDIREALEQTERQAEALEQMKKTETPYYSKVRADIRSLRQCLRRDDDE
ncbi:hypothetical protein QUF72_07025 [Desulfobacterales bacterium HSG2]|nr:hypothetical protein [Desulfobacterales bacterium HSG2]